MPERSLRIFRGRFQIYQNPQSGQLVVTKWPRKRSASSIAKVQKSIDLFRQYATQTKLIIPSQYNDCKAVAEGTGFMWRDIFEMLQCGRLLVIVTTDGHVYRSYRDMMREIQADLDTITNVTGAVLIRTLDGWRGVVGTKAGQVLTCYDPVQPPDFLDLGGNGGGSNAEQVWATPTVADLPVQHFGAGDTLSAFAYGVSLQSPMRYPGADFITLAGQAMKNGAGSAFTLTCRLRSTWPPLDNMNAGLCVWREANLASWLYGYGSKTAGLSVTYCNSQTNPISQPQKWGDCGSDVWLRLFSDGLANAYYFSRDGFEWVRMWAELYTDHTDGPPDHVGLFIDSTPSFGNSQMNGTPGTLQVLSWDLTYP